MSRPRLLLVFWGCLHLLLAGNFAFSQERCGTDQYMKMVRGATSTPRFEEWIKNRIPVRSKETGREQSKSYKIPVVIHIIHNGVSSSTNIPDAQVISQIRVLNEDFKRLNADASNTPSTFASVAGSIDLEFVLAKQTPEGLPTNGIVRVQGSKTSWTINDNYTLKATSYWPAENYLNIWVCNLTDYLGFSQFPETNLLDGLETASSNRLTDGIVINYQAFGSIQDGNFNLQSSYNRGRTTTHEVGHFLGLRHIWGDDGGSCGNSGDYVTDTPDQGDRTFGCPTHPKTTCTNVVSMFQNFLDYTNDVCMNLFTIGQVARMEIILDNSPRRASLSSSPGLNEPAPVLNDLGVKDVISPGSGSCAGSVTPEITVRNYGSNEISSFTIQLKKNGAVVSTLPVSVTLQPLEGTNVTFPPVSVSAGTVLFSFEITETNGTTDGNTGNNKVSQSTAVPQLATLPIVENFDAVPTDWLIVNPDDHLTWKFASPPPSNGAMTINFYDYEDAQGEVDLLITPLINLENAQQALLKFDVSYAPFDTSVDGLKVVVLKDCQRDITTGDIIYSKAGNDLATHPATTDNFIPASANDWRSETIDLAAYAGAGGIQIAFVGVNDWGNNVYLDNVRFVTEAFKNVTLQRIITPQPVVCAPTFQPRLTILNSGTSVSVLTVHYSINGEPNNVSIPVENFTAGSTQEILLPEVTLREGSNDLSFSIVELDGESDLDPSDNTIVSEIIYSTASITVPFREGFEKESTPWSTISPAGNESWVNDLSAGNHAMMYAGFTNSVVDDKAWLISPPINLSEVEEASLRFYTSYRMGNSDETETLEVRASKGCTLPFEDVLVTYTGADLDDRSSAGAWKPASQDDYEEKILHLDSYVGEHELRIAFVVTNKNSNNLYLDDIELFLTSSPGMVKVDAPFMLYPNPEIPGSPVNMAFKLAEPETISIEILESTGRLVQRFSADNILNQVLQLKFTDKAPGVYYIRVVTSSKSFTRKFVHRN